MAIEQNLKIFMAENQIPDKASLAKQTGINIQTLNRRIKAPSNFTLGELAAIADVLSLDDDQVLSIVKEVIWGREKLMKKKKR